MSAQTAANAAEEDETGTIVPSSRSGTHKYVSALKTIKPGCETVPSEEDLLCHAEYGNIEFIQRCLSSRIYINCKEPEYGMTPLLAAAAAGRTAAVTLLISKGANVLASDNNRETALHYAAKSNYIDIAKQLLDSGVAVDASTKEGRTSLHFAAQWGHLEIARLLLDRGANLKCETSSRETPLHVAALNDRAVVASFLLERGARIEAVNEFRSTPLHLAAQRGHVDTVKVLLNHGASVTATTKIQWTPLHNAAKEGKAEVIKILLDAGADVNLATKTGRTPVQLAPKFSYAVDVLLEHGAVYVEDDIDLEARTDLMRAPSMKVTDVNRALSMKTDANRSPSMKMSDSMNTFSTVSPSSDKQQQPLSPSESFRVQSENSSANVSYGTLPIPVQQDEVEVVVEQT